MGKVLKIIRIFWRYAAKYCCKLHLKQPEHCLQLDSFCKTVLLAIWLVGLSAVPCSEWLWYSHIQDKPSHNYLTDNLTSLRVEWMSLVLCTFFAVWQSCLWALKNGKTFRCLVVAFCRSEHLLCVICIGHKEIMFGLEKMMILYVTLLTVV